jgi:quercetin dioxygenase-like cupin family protein
VFKQIIPPDPNPGADPPARPDQGTHDGHEWLYVIAGRLRLTLGDKTFILTSGQAAEFDTRIPHAVTNAGTQPAELLNVFGPQGERVHLRAGTRSSVRPVHPGP